jgi:60 kDa SS-A/Ro ribonucleoprotein
MQKLHTHFSTRQTPQSEPIPGAGQVKNRAGGFVWEIDKWSQLDRFLILGIEGGTYYVSERKLAKEQSKSALDCIKEDGLRVVRRVVEISDEGRAVKNDPALFVLAMAAKLGDENTRAAAYKALPKVARIGTHLFHWMEYVKAFGGLGGNGLKRALGRWYTEMPAWRVALQAVKYQQRDGWSHRDLLRLAHPQAPTGDHQSIFHYIVKGRTNGLTDVTTVPKDLRLIWAWETAKTLKPSETKRMVELITEYKLPHECVPNEFKSQPEIWDALSVGMPVGAMIRNLNKMTAVGLVTNTSEVTKRIVATLGDGEVLQKARLHPMAVLVAMKQYAAGRGLKGSLTWQPAPRVVDALDKAFYLAFRAVEPTGKTFCLALDVSGSMTGAHVSGAPNVTCREAAAAMALVTMNVESAYECIGFTCGGVGKGIKTGGSGWFGGQNGVTQLAISPRQRLDDVVRYTAGLGFGGTDCSLPMIWAKEHKVPVDVFAIYTDNETWAGGIHPSQALNEYRQKMGRPAKLVVVAMTGDKFSIADPKDSGQLDVVGFDAATPNLISSFSLE